MPVNFFRILSTSLLCLVLAACVPPTARSKKDSAVSAATGDYSLSRADPGYVYYLERKSMLWNAGEDSRIVSGSDLAWRRPGYPADPGGLAGMADVWLWISPQNLLVYGRKSPLEQLAEPATWMLMRRLGIKGLYVAPAAASGLLWSYDRNPYSDGEDVVQYDFSENAGKKEHFLRLLQSANAEKSILGGDLAPTAPGIGPDFFLAARAHRDYPGAFCLIEVPRELWPLLPKVEGEWQAQPLDRVQEQDLSAKKLLPPAMQQDFLPFGPDYGWAATGEVRGVDGNLKRWVYRYYGTPKRPILNWEDPSAAARRVVSGSVIRQAGLLGNALVGYKTAPLLGLDSAAADLGGAAPGYAPGMEAAQAIGREARRYGAWSWQRDVLPLSLVKQSLEDNSADFITDSALTPAAEHALLSGDSELLDFMLDELLARKIDLRRLVHASTGPEGLDYDLPHLAVLAGDSDNPKAARAGELRKKALAEAESLALTEGEDESQFLGERLYTTPAGLAALALGAADPAKVTPDLALEAGKGLRVLITFKAMLPGLLVLSGQDLAGSLPLNWRSMEDSPAKWDKRLSSRGTYMLFANAESISVSAQGVPRAKSIHAAPDVQMHAPGSFGQYLTGLTALRAKLEISRGVFLGRLPTGSPGVTATVVRLPEGKGFLLSVCNFSRKKTDLALDNESIPELREQLRNQRIEELLAGHAVTTGGRTLRLSLDAWESAALLVK